MTDITELAQRMKAAAVRAQAATEEYASQRISSTAFRLEIEEFESLANKPANILALVEKLELKEEQRANWFQMAQKLGEDLDAAEKRIAELEGALEVSQEDLSDTEDAMHLWAERAKKAESDLGSRTVKLPKLPKLPKLKILEDYLAEVAIEERKQILTGVKLEFHRALTAAGIKLEGE